MEIQKEMDAAEETISSLNSDKEGLSQEVLQAQKEMLALVEQAKVGDSAKSQLTSLQDALKTSNEQLLEATVSLIRGLRTQVRLLNARKSGTQYCGTTTRSRMRSHDSFTS